EEQPLPAAVLPTAESPRYIMHSNPEMDPKEDDRDDEKSEGDFIDYSTSRGDDDADNDGDELSEDDADDEDEKESSDSEEEEEKLLASTVLTPALHRTPPIGTPPLLPNQTSGNQLVLLIFYNGETTFLRYVVYRADPWTVRDREGSNSGESGSSSIPRKALTSSKSRKLLSPNRVSHLLRIKETRGSGSKSTTTKSAGKWNIPTLTETSLAIPFGLDTERSASSRVMQVGVSSGSASSFYTENGMRFMLAPRSASARHSSIPGNSQGMRNLSGSPRIDGFKLGIDALTGAANGSETGVSDWVTGGCTCAVLCELGVCTWSFVTSEGIREVGFDLQPSKGGNRCFLGYNWLLKLVTHTRGCYLDKRFRWWRDSFGTNEYHRR
nr:hypothetical protein [Tanacetum cinerariifolium]